MKTALIIIAAFAFAAAAPKATKSVFKNIYKEPIVSNQHKPNPKIIGGQEAEPHSIPFQAFLEIYSMEDAWYCSGSIISENYLVTAAHCCISGLQATIVLGAHRPLEYEDTQLLVYSSDILSHESYHAGEVDNDIGVIRFPNPITFTDAIQPVPLPTQADASNDFSNQIATVSGWGYTVGNAHMLSEVLNYATLLVMTNEDCEKIMGPLIPSILCTSGSDNSGTCDGDSGGPLVVNNILIGIVTFGATGCPPGLPDGYTRVTSFLDWLQENSDVIIR